MARASDTINGDPMDFETVIGLGERPIMKSHYPELRRQLNELERFRSLLNQIGEMIFVLSLPDCRIVDINDTTARLLCCEKGALIGKLFFGLVAEVPQTLHLQTALAGRDDDTELSPEIVQTRLAYHVDRPVIVELSLRRRQFDSADYGIVVARDVGAQLMAEQVANRANQRLVDAIESLPDAFAIYDADDRLALYNSKYLETYEKSRQAIQLGRTFEEILRAGVERGQYPQAIGREEAWVAERMAIHRDPHGEFELELSNGRWVLVRERRTQHGETVGERTDITELKHREHALIAANRRIEEQADDLRRFADDLREAHDRADAAREVAESANRAKSNFLAMMSHELRTPLNAIIGFAEMMTEGHFGALGNPHYEDYAASIRDSGQHLLSIINSILDLAKMEAGRYDVQDDAIDVADVIARTFVLLKPTAAQRGVEMVRCVDPGLPILTADQGLVDLVLTNLASNAVKFTPCGGKVSIAARRNRQRGVEIVVADTGIGMAADDIVRAMRPFEQVDQSMSRRFSGTGLGLPLVHFAVTLHGGTLGVESEPGQGTRFTVAFPPERVSAQTATDGLGDADNSGGPSAGCAGRRCPCNEALGMEWPVPPRAVCSG